MSVSPLLSLPPLSVLALDAWLNWLIWIVGVPTGLYAFVHALRQRSDAFTAADKLTKPAWAAITGGGAAMLVLMDGPASQTAIFWLIALIAVLVYLVDVRPRVVGIQEGPRW